MEKIQKAEHFKNVATDNFLRQLFYTTVIGSFGYEGDIPKFIGADPDYIEECLFYGGTIAYFKHTQGDGEYYIANCYPAGILMKNGLYDRYTIIFRNGETFIYKYEEIEICFNNTFKIPSIITVNEIIEKCLRSLRSVDMSLIKASMPNLLACEDETRLTQLMEKLTKSYEMVDPLSVVSGDWVENEVKKVELYDNRAQDILALWDIFVRYKNLFFTTFGINNVEISKTERLTQAEGQSNTEITRYGLFNDMYSHRVDWCNRIKNHFGKELKCVINRNVDTVVELNLTTEEKIQMKNDMIAPYKEGVKTDKSEVNEIEENSI